MHLKIFFSKPSISRQRQYEAIRTIIMERTPVADAAKKYGYTLSTLYTFLRDAKSGRLKLFPKTALGPTKRRTPDKLQKMIVKKRKLNMSANEIRDDLATANIKISASTIERILADANFSKLPRRTNAELGNTVRNQIISKRTKPIDFDNLKPFHLDCPTIGIFFFLPYIIESGIVDIAQKCNLPKSSSINAKHACLSMLRVLSASVCDKVILGV